jgi:hypothetical protein
MLSCCGKSLIQQVEGCQSRWLKVYFSLDFPVSDAIRAAELNEKAKEGLLRQALQQNS